MDQKPNLKDLRTNTLWPAGICNVLLNELLAQLDKFLESRCEAFGECEDHTCPLRDICGG